MDNWSMRMIKENTENLEIVRDKAEVFEEAWSYEIDIEEAFTELYQEMRNVECNELNQKRLNTVLDQIIRNINDLKEIMNLIENESDE